MALLKCADHGYTLQAACPQCSKTAIRPGPARYSPEDPYGEYRRRLKALTKAESAGAPAKASVDAAAAPRTEAAGPRADAADAPADAAEEGN